MDAFYASVEIRDNPELRGKPLIIGALPSERGVVSTCSYEARKFGVRSAMSIKDAYRLCPQGIYMHPNPHKYHKASEIVRKIWMDYTDLIELQKIIRAIEMAVKNSAIKIAPTPRRAKFRSPLPRLVMLCQNLFITHFHFYNFRTIFVRQLQDGVRHVQTVVHSLKLIRSLPQQFRKIGCLFLAIISLS